MGDHDLGGDHHGDGMTVQKCQDLIEKSLTTPKVETILEFLKKRGCRYSITAVNCGKNTQSGLYGKKFGIKICSDNMCCDPAVEKTLLHQLVYAYDECRGAFKDSNDIHRFACTQIRAGNLSHSHDCDDKPECVKRDAISTVSQCHFSEAEAKSAVEAVWDTCYNDISPFGK